jgi:hypothetical protein
MRASPFVLPLAAALALGCGSDPTPPVTPDATTPDATTPDATAPDATTPDAITPDAITPDATTPDATAPGVCIPARGAGTAPTDRYVDGTATASVTLLDPASCQRTYLLTSTAPLRDGQPSNPRRVAERASFPTLRTRNDLFDALYALAQDEARENSVSAIRDGSFNDGAPIDCPPGGCFETGRLWTYVWTRDTAYSVHLALGALDPTRARNSMEFKLSARRGGGGVQVVQDTGTGGSYPVSTDRVVWALGAQALLAYLDGDALARFSDRAFEALRNTVDHDRAVVFDPVDGLYRGEHSFLDWREQSYPGWTATDTTHIGMSKSLSTNVLHFAALQTVAALATARGDMAAARTYGEHADALRTALRARFWDAAARQFRAFVTTGLDPAPVQRWDLLGSALAVLTGVADAAQARAVTETYPHAGRGAAPVLWPQQQFTPIYHNRAMWPFVTAYWLRAARAVRNDAVVNRNVDALVRAAALNLSNMENLEIVSGSPRVEEGPTSGPVVNSQRQLWSVAGYLSMVHDVIFGQEATAAGIRFRPYVTRAQRNTLFANADSLALNDVVYRGRTLAVVVNLPPRSADRNGAYAVGAVRVNGRDVGDAFLSPSMLDPRSTVEVTLVDTPEPAAPIREVDASVWRNLFGPRTPAITRVDLEPGTGRLRLALDRGGEDPTELRFNVYRHGRLVARDLPGSTTTWVDPELRDGASPEACYTVETLFPSGNASQRAQPQCWWGRDGHLVRPVPAQDFANTGGSPSTNHGRFHFENWGDPGHRLEVPYFRPDTRGEHLVQLIAGNGSGGFTTGITCAVKRVRVQELPAGTDVATGYALMAQAGSWSEWRGSSFVRANLDPARAYRIVVDDDERAVNMSAFAHFERYTGGTGGRGGSFQRVNIAEVRVLPLTGGSGDAAAVPLDGTNDIERFGTSGLLPAGVPSAPDDAVAIRFDDAYLYAAVRVRAMAQGELRPYVLYFQSSATPLPPAAPRNGVTYFDQTPTVPFQADYAVVLRRRNDAGDGAGPYAGLFRWDGTRWTRAQRYRDGVEVFPSAGGVSVRLTRASLGSPRHLRLVGHAVQGSGLYNTTVPAAHQPWTAGRAAGFYELDLAAPSPAAAWTAR